MPSSELLSQERPAEGVKSALGAAIVQVVTGAAPGEPPEPQKSFEEGEDAPSPLSPPPVSPLMPPRQGCPARPPLVPEPAPPPPPATAIREVDTALHTPVEAPPPPLQQPGAEPPPAPASSMKGDTPSFQNVTVKSPLSPPLFPVEPPPPPPARCSVTAAPPGGAM